MSLMRLLSAGKSWVSGKDEAVRYRLSDPRALPKFGSEKNPFRSTTRSGQPVDSISSAQPTPPPPLPQQQETVGARSAPVRSSQENPTTSALLPERCHSSDARAGTVRAPAQPPNGWWEKLAAMIPGNRRGSKPTKATRALKPAVQGELSLEKIQVMRNDLSDTDLEVIPAKKQAPPVKNIAVRQPENIPAPEAGRNLFHEADANMVGRS